MISKAMDFSAFRTQKYRFLGMTLPLIHQYQYINDIYYTFSRHYIIHAYRPVLRHLQRYAFYKMQHSLCTINYQPLRN